MRLRRVLSGGRRALWCGAVLCWLLGATAWALDPSRTVFQYGCENWSRRNGLPASGVDARRGQYRLFDLPGVRLELAREVIRAKIHNQRVMQVGRRLRPTKHPAQTDLAPCRIEQIRAPDNQIPIIIHLLLLCPIQLHG